MVYNFNCSKHNIVFRIWICEFNIFIVSVNMEKLVITIMILLQKMLSIWVISTLEVRCTALIDQLTLINGVEINKIILIKLIEGTNIIIF